MTIKDTSSIREEVLKANPEGEHMEKGNNARCPVCEEIIFLESYLHAGNTTACQGCGVVMEVMEGIPLRIKEAELVGS